MIILLAVLVLWFGGWWLIKANHDELGKLLLGLLVAAGPIVGVALIL